MIDLLAGGGKELSWRRSRVGMKNWREHAECRDCDVNLFFAPERPHRPQKPQERITEKERVAAAKAICARCLVQEDCLAFALSEDVSGLWGGMTEKERRRYQGPVP